ncbi:TetR/AcrR family transcriptional regulator [Ramlibacter sp. XY19]|uniref:TetR/AcrR family transcriptional regulator n=1 Tax=Ramlibacter paludis TaxID=2908000 RepID=UPI0023DADDE8|nr:TetR/AcrR family transcriptional regulator [Ramlibacter paludis]MCG2593231.1 TetR/AcrR family transcriptional regulator [Ramlibacter paludis]
MDDPSRNAGLPPLPAPLAAAFVAAAGGGGKRERTQAALVLAAVNVFCARGVAGATVQEVAQVAGMTPATVYNHFASKEALIERVALALAEGLSRAIGSSHAGVEDGAERMAIGQRRFLWLAAEAPAWALLLLDVGRANPTLGGLLQVYPLADLRLGLKQKRFKVPNEAAAMDAISGICMTGMQTVALGLAPPKHDIAIATVVLRALGMEAAEAAEVAKRPLPPLLTAEPEPGAAAAKRGRAPARRS